MPASKMPATKKAANKPAPKSAVKSAAPKLAEKKLAEKKLAAKAAPVKTAPVKQAAQPAKPASKPKKDTPTVTSNKPDANTAAPKASQKDRAELVADNNVTLPPNYKPSDKEDYMSPRMLAYFKGQLERWKQDLLSDSSDTLESLSDGGMQEPDITDRATAETDRALEFRTRDRERKLIRKIDEALGRIEADEFGYCDETGEPIGIKRLMARPIATLTVEAQERHERQERTQRDEADE